MSNLKKFGMYVIVVLAFAGGKIGFKYASKYHHNTLTQSELTAAVDKDKITEGFPLVINEDMSITDYTGELLVDTISYKFISEISLSIDEVDIESFNMSDSDFLEACEPTRKNFGYRNVNKVFITFEHHFNDGEVITKVGNCGKLMSI